VISTASRREPTSDRLVDDLDRAARESNKVLVRWLLGNDVPLFAGCVLLTLQPLNASEASGCWRRWPPRAARRWRRSSRAWAGTSAETEALDGHSGG
jgi:hypothetical protein